jgi:hypothetical protein
MPTRPQQLDAPQTGFEGRPWPKQKRPRSPALPRRKQALLIILLVGLGGLAFPRRSLFMTQARSESLLWTQLPPEPGTQRQQPLTPPSEPAPPLSVKQKQELLKSNFENMKKNTEELLELAKSLQKELDKSNQNVLSLQVVVKAEKIERLAKKIKSTARGY